MKTLSILILFSSIALGQNPCTLNSKIKIVKPKQCDKCTQVYATTNKAGQFTYLWSTGETNDTIQVCDTIPDIYSVTVTDTSGCFDVDSLQVSNAKKCVDICHRRGNGRKTVWNNLCVSSNAVQAHVLHGDSVGCCGSNQPTRIINVHSNNGNHNGHRKLELEYISNDIETTLIRLVDLAGKEWYSWIETTSLMAVEYQSDLPDGVYIVIVQTPTAVTTQKFVIIN